MSILLHETECGEGEAEEKGGLKLAQNSFEGRRY